MPSIFRTWTYKHAVDALAAINAATVGADGFKANLLYAERGDHWQEGNAWPVSGSLNPMIRQAVLKAIEPQFRPVDVIGEVLDNVANGLLDKEPDLTFVARTPASDPESEEAKAQATAIATMNARVSAWWDQKQFWEQVRKAVRRSRWATRGALRLWISPDTMVVQREPTTNVVTSTSLPSNLKFEDALTAVHVMAPTPETGFVFTDPDTQQRCGVFFFGVAAGADAASQQTAKKYAELWFTDGDETIVRVVAESSAEAREFPIKTGKRIPIAQMAADLLITDTVRRQQRSLNFVETLTNRVVETAGFPERYTTNAMPQGMWIATPPLDAPPLETRTVSDGEGGQKTWYLHQVPRALGPMITTDLRGIALEDGDTGKKTLSSPGIVFKEPTDPEYLTKVSEHNRMTILRECKQGHLANQSTAETSGLAYVQARAIFGKDLRATKAPLEGMVRDIIEGAIALAESMSGTVPGQGESFLANFRCVVNLHVDTGPTSPLEMAEFRAQNQAGLLARESAMARAGVEDTAAEIDALTRDPVALASLRKAQGDAIRALTGAGATFIGAARAIGLSDKEAADLTTPDPVGDVTP